MVSSSSSSFPQTPSHHILYGLIGRLSEEQADLLEDPLRDLIKKVKHEQEHPRKK